jgi:hypothetical protein
MSLEKALTVFGNDSMPALGQHNIPGLGQVKGNSFTRNPLLGSSYTTPSSGDPVSRRIYKFVVRLTVDQAKLAQTHRMIPINAEFVNPASTVGPAKSERSKSIPQRRMDEEFVMGDIKGLHQYVTAIEILPLVARTKGFDPELARLIKTYSEKFRIPLKMDQDTEYWFNMGVHWSKPEYAARPHPDKSEIDQPWNQRSSTPKDNAAGLAATPQPTTNLR